MNKRLVLKSSYDELVYCVLDMDQPLQDELDRLFSITKGGGYSVDMTDTKVKLVDYFHGDTVASWSIVSFEQTQEEPLHRLTPCT